MRLCIVENTLLALDGSDYSNKTLRWADDLARLSVVTLRAIKAFE
jgi:hypothetical protein